MHGIGFNCGCDFGETSINLDIVLVTIGLGNCEPDKTTELQCAYSTYRIVTSGEAILSLQ